MIVSCRGIVGELEKIERKGLIYDSQTEEEDNSTRYLYNISIAIFYKGATLIRGFEEVEESEITFQN